MCFVCVGSMFHCGRF